MTAVGVRIATVLAALAIATVVGSCGGSSTDSHAGHTGGVDSTHEAHDSDHNPDDIAFAHNMIPHHQQALELAAMVPTNTVNHDVVVLAKHIALDQQAEIEIMQGLLDQWGQARTPDHGGHTGHGGMVMEGIVDDDTMNRLRSLTGPAFDTLWLQSMIYHHQGAVTMAEREIAQGRNADAIKLAKIIVAAQQWEIARMNHLISVPE